MSVPDLTSEERDFLWAWRRGLAGALGQYPTAVAEAHAAARRAVDALADQYVSRTERLVVLAALARATTEARDELLAEVLASRYEWQQHGDDPDDWRALAWDSDEVSSLAALADLSRQTIRTRIRAIAAETLADAKAAAATSEGVR